MSSELINSDQRPTLVAMVDPPAIVSRFDDVAMVCQYGVSVWCVSMVCQYGVSVWCVSRSRSAVVILGSVNTLDHSEKKRLVVSRMDERS